MLAIKVSLLVFIVTIKFGSFLDSPIKVYGFFYNPGFILISLLLLAYTLKPGDFRLLLYHYHSNILGIQMVFLSLK